MGIHAMIVYFCFVLIDLINGYKNVYSRNNACLEFFEMDFNITIDSVMNFDKKNHPQVYLEECKYRVKKIQMPRFINTELKSDSESDSDLDSEKIGAKVDNELMTKLEKSGSDSE